ncbi:ATP-binding cassette domain-containing protein [Exilibacterium tricleocarpae]|uniref:ATP-binding cassette domain-containing protein n=1 Tax=Exilibacterium tricleocarpae TaxID=2591008 RepID=A0A545U827_9GAMM|nr:ATP-binding cassette domain-containing protein [Exilibacterium tricleocarpae]TQV85622.1 ATP-binding cassette domain-containing protein [Exilibacterium tricleocarpae]
MIEIHQLSKRFDTITAVDNLSFQVAPGEVLGFLGPNGAGKSTTMKMITGFLTPDSGRISIYGTDISGDPIAAKQQIGYLPEGAPCYGDMTVLHFLRFIASVRRLGREEKGRRIGELISLLQLASVQHQTIDTLSKGYKRRVGLAQAILHDPKVLILDEPTDGLDPNQKHQVRELIRNLAQDKIVIISTHLLEEVSAVCSRAIIIHRGAIIADGTPAQLQAHSKYHKAITLRFTQPYPVAQTLATLPGVAEVVGATQGHGYTVFPEAGVDISAAVSACIHDRGWCVAEMHTLEGRLDEVFRQLTGGQS